MDQLEVFLDNIGLMRGDAAIALRMGFGAIISGLVLTYLQPSSMFVDGMALDFGLSMDNPNVTFMPWWLLSALIGLAFGVFI